MVKKEFVKGKQALEAGAVGISSKAKRFESANQNFLLGALGKSFKKLEINLEEVLKREQGN